jgi:hypothetical protein
MVRLTPGPPIGEPVPLHPGGWDGFRDRGTPTMAQRVFPANDALADLAIAAGEGAYSELGLSGRLHIVFFTAEDPPGAAIPLSRTGLSARFRIDAFAADGQTDPPSVWLRLDGSEVSEAELTRRIRHEFAHVRLGRDGIAPGPIAEALADTFAEHGLDGLRAQLGRPADGLRLATPSGTVIIDGTSDMFKISATGTMIRAFPAAGNVNFTNATLSGLGTYSTVPACLWSTTYDNSAIGNARKGNTHKAVNLTTGVVKWEATSFVYINGSSIVVVELDSISCTTNPATIGSTRYYVLEEAGI